MREWLPLMFAVSGFLLVFWVLVNLYTQNDFLPLMVIGIPTQTGLLK